MKDICGFAKQKKSLLLILCPFKSIKANVTHILMHKYTQQSKVARAKQVKEEHKVVDVLDC